MLIADTSGLLALFNDQEPAHEAVSALVSREVDHPSGAVVVSPFVVAELDYLVNRRLGVPAELSMLDELAGGAFVLAAFGSEELRQSAEVMDNYRDLAIGVTDASLVVLAHRYLTDRVLTLDRRHFLVLQRLTGGPLNVVPN